MQHWTEYRKGLIAAAIPALLAGLSVLESALTDGGSVTPSTLVGIAIAILGALLVYVVPNDPPAIDIGERIGE